jgi:hypothetical protein
MKNFKHIGQFDYQPILAEVATSPLWNWLNFRKVAGHEDDLILRYQSIEGHRPIQSIMTDLRCVDYIVAGLFPKTMSLIKSTFKDPIGRIVFARLPAGAKIAEHTDEGLYSETTNRHHFVVTTNSDVWFQSGDERHQMQRGNIYWFNNHIPHKVENLGDTPRIHLIVDTYDYTH